MENLTLTWGSVCFNCDSDLLILGRLRGVCPVVAGGGAEAEGLAEDEPELQLELRLDAHVQAHARAHRLRELSP